MPSFKIPATTSTTVTAVKMNWLIAQRWTVERKKRQNSTPIAKRSPLKESRPSPLSGMMV